MNKNRMYEAAKKHILVIALCIVAAIFCAMSIWQNYILSGYSNEKSIVGTYGIALEDISSNKYWVFTSNNTYMHYDQTNVIEEGTYRIDELQKGNRIVTLRNVSDNKETQLVRIGNSIFCPDKNGTLVFERINDVPVFAGVTPTL